MTGPVARLRQWLLTGRPPEPASAAEAIALVAAAREQGVAGLLHAALEVCGAWPDEARRALAELRVQLTARALRQKTALDRSLEVLASAGLRALPLKGAALVGLVYDDTGERPMADLDLLAVDSFEDSLAALSRARFGETERADHAVALQDPETGLMVELHRSPTSCPGFYRVAPLAAWDRAVPLTGGPGRRRPSNEDLLLLLCLHMAFQHGLRLRLIHYLDVRRLLTKVSLDVEALVAYSVEARAETAVWAALSASSVLVGASVPPELIEPLRSRVSAALVRVLSSRLRDPEAVLMPPRAEVGRDLLEMRWLLASGRRREWLRRTLVPAAPPGQRDQGRTGRALHRGLVLARRWWPFRRRTQVS